MKIAQACFRFAAPGGAEEHVLQISREMARRGHEVTVHASDIFTETPWVRGDWTRETGEGRWQTGDGRREVSPGVVPAPGSQLPAPERLDGIKVVRHKAYIRPISGRWSMLIIPDMISGLLKEDCDIYHAHSHRYFQLEAATCAARARGKPLIITPHYHPAEKNETLRTRMMLKLYDLYSSGSIYRHARKVLTMTDLERTFMASMVPAGKFATVGAGIDPEEWKDIPSPEMFREKAGIEGPYLLFCGRLASNKGLGTLFDALPSVLKDFDGEMVILGKDWGMKTVIEEKARRSGINRKVRFIDFLPDRKLYKSALAGCEMLLLPSQWEAFGIVLLEAAMCRRPVVATAVGGVPAVVVDGKTGLLVPYGNPIALSDAITDLLEDGQRRKNMGEDARALVLQKHTWPRVVDRILKAYGDVDVKTRKA
jgi:glycosyltransferase involved in cell wall biosynthesis